MSYVNSQPDSTSSIGKLLKTTAQAWPRHYSTILPLILLLTLAAALPYLVSIFIGPLSLKATIGAIVFQAVFGLFFTAALIYQLQQNLTNAASTAREALRAACHRYWRLLLFTLLIGLAGTLIVGMAIGLIKAVLATLALHQQHTRAITLLIDAKIVITVVKLAVFIVGFYFGIRLVFSGILIIIEDVSILNAVKHSFHITGKYWWRCFAWFLIMGLIVSLLPALLSMLLGFLHMLLSSVWYVNVINEILLTIFMMHVLSFYYCGFLIFLNDLEKRNTEQTNK